MRRILVVAAVVLAGLLASSAMAGNQDTCVINYEIGVILEVDIAADSLFIGIGSVPAGQPIQGEAETTYAITHNWEDGVTLTGHINQGMPYHVTLSAQAAAPNAGGQSTGWQELGTDPRALVQNIVSTAESGLALKFRLSAEPDAFQVQGSRTFTLTATAQQ